MYRLKTTLIILLSITMFSACSGEKQDTPQPSQSSDPVIINGHTLPSEPDPKINNSTLLGIDSNNNDVRDDVEIWIYQTYKDKHPIHIDIAMQAARGYKLVLEHPDRALEIHDEVGAPQYCQYYYMYDAKYFNESILINSAIITKTFIKNIYFNTDKRLSNYLQYDKLLSGGIYSLPKDSEEKSYCDFNTSKYKKE